MIRSAGASEVHLRVASPMVLYPDFYGIDIPDPTALLANKCSSPQEMCNFIGVDSLGFLSVDGLYNAICGIPRDPQNPAFADHCFTGDYPTPLVDKQSQHNDEELSLIISS